MIVCSVYLRLPVSPPPLDLVFQDFTTSPFLPFVCLKNQADNLKFVQLGFLKVYEKKRGYNAQRTVLLSSILLDIWNSLF